MSPLRTELQIRWRRMFSLLKEGADVTPSLRLRTEGLMEAVALVGLARAGEIDDEMDGVYRAIYGHGLTDAWGQDWRGFYPFPQIPAMATRAPVFPTTRD